MVIISLNWGPILDAIGGWFSGEIPWPPWGPGNGTGGSEIPPHTQISDDFNIMRDWWDFEPSYVWEYTPDGRLRNTGQASWGLGGKAINNYGVFQDGEVEVQLIVEYGGNYYNRPNNYILLRIWPGTSGLNGYFVGMTDQAFTDVRGSAVNYRPLWVIGKLSNGGLSWLAKSDGMEDPVTHDITPAIHVDDVEFNRIYNLKARIETIQGLGTKITLIVDGMPLLFTYDMTWQQRGYTGLSGWFYAALWDNWSFVSLDTYEG